MTFQQRADKSVNNLRVIFAMDITVENEQWVNAGVGVWVVNTDALYENVEDELLSWFTPQSFPAIGSVLSDSIQLVEASTLLECSDNEASFYFDGTNLYVHLENGDSPYIHTVSVGVVFGYSREGFTPIGARTHYASRLLGVPSISKSRDPLYWGKLQFEGGSAELNNGDGGLDQLGEDNNAYGNQARVLVGFEDQPYTEYERLFTGFVDTLNVDERSVTVSFKDKRKQLTKNILYSCTDLNALEAIEEILLDNYEIPYNGLYYDMDLWEDAKSKALDVTIAMTKEEKAIDVIQKICESTFGIFLTDPIGRYAFKIIRKADPATYEIPEHDIINNPSATYDPSEVITSTLIGYERDWTTTGSAYTYLNDTSQEASIFDKYKTYNQRTFDTMLGNVVDAQRFSDQILEYSGTIRAKVDIEVPLKYYTMDVGDFAEIEINRSNSTWFGLRKCEVLRKVYNLDRGTISFTVKIYGSEISYRVTTDGEYRYTTSDELRKVGS